MSESIRVVLISTSHPGNIGAVARAMKNMCLTDLRLVQPRQFPHADANARAAGATDILEQAVVCDTLDEAVADCSLVIGASTRERRMAWPMMDARQSAEKLVAEGRKGPVAVIFGREHAGLTNEELDRCHYLLQIPANSEFSSLNVAAAAQVVCYEIMMQRLQSPIEDNASPERELPEGELLATGEEVARFYDHMEETLVKIDFLDPDNPGLVMRRLRRLFNRTHLVKSEINILRGILQEATVYNKKISS